MKPAEVLRVMQEHIDFDPPIVEHETVWQETAPQKENAGKWPKGASNASNKEMDPNPESLQSKQSIEEVEKTKNNVNSILKASLGKEENNNRQSTG